MENPTHEQRIREYLVAKAEEKAARDIELAKTMTISGEIHYIPLGYNGYTRKSTDIRHIILNEMLEEAGLTEKYLTELRDKIKAQAKCERVRYLAEDFAVNQALKDHKEKGELVRSLDEYVTLGMAFAWRYEHHDARHNLLGRAFLRMAHPRRYKLMRSH